MPSIRKKGMNVSFKAKKSICVTVNSHSKNSKTNNPKTSSSDNIIGNSNLPSINVFTKSSLKKINTLWI